MLKKNLIIFLFLVGCLFYLIKITYAIDLQSPRFKFEFNEIVIKPEQNSETVYTLTTIFGSKAMGFFRNRGYILADSADTDTVNFSLSQSLITFNLSDVNSENHKINYSISRFNPRDFRISLFQEYPFKSFSDDELDIQYRLSETDPFRILPKKSYTQILTGTEKASGEIYLKPVRTADNKEGTYETTINFIVNSD